VSIGATTSLLLLTACGSDDGMIHEFEVA